MPKVRHRTASDWEQLKIVAIEHIREGRRATEIASKLGLARTTVLGWLRHWKTHREPAQLGRPRRLPPFNESKIFEILRKERTFYNWDEVRDTIKKQSGETLSRGTIFRLLQKWEIRDGTSTENGSYILSPCRWIQPANTIHAGPAQEATLWRLRSGRGLEAFAFTNDESQQEAAKVFQSLVDFAQRSRNFRLIKWVNNRGNVANRIG